MLLDDHSSWGWESRALVELADYHNGMAFKPSDWSEEGTRIIRIQQLNDPTGSYDHYSGFFPEDNRIVDGDLIFSWSATLKVAIWKHGPGVLNQHLFKVVPKPGVDKHFLFHVLDFHMDDIAGGSHGSTMRHIKRGELKKYHVYLPEMETEQRKIARILTTVDNLIERTEALIAKYQAVKRGLLHDLLTRGVDAQGRLRPPREEADDLYKESPLGWIPREWEVAPLKSLVDSAVDGPFGSNLKIEHYVKEPGVRVVRLQNIANGYFDESDRAYIAASHAQYLKRHEVVAGDLLVASMGDDNHLIARACLYPDHLQAGIVKADCFRLRLLNHLADHGFVMHMLNCSSTRDDIDKFAQGVTRNRVNLGNLQKVRLRVPPVAEQRIIAKILFALDQKIETEANTLMKLTVVKAGLMQDLLTGEVRVCVDEE